MGLFICRVTLLITHVKGLITLVPMNLQVLKGSWDLATRVIIKVDILKVLVAPMPGFMTLLSPMMSQVL